MKIALSNMPKGVYNRTEKHYQQLIRARSFIDEKAIKKLSNSLKGRIPWNKDKKGLQKNTEEQKKKRSEMAKELGFGKWMKDKLGENANAWRGEEAGYGAKHMWIRKHRGQPHYCEHCKRSDLHDRDYNWANISGEYKRDIYDYIRLCISCHRKYDMTPEKIIILKEKLKLANEIRRINKRCS